MPPVVITLNEEEMDYVAYVGVRRRIRNLLRNSQPLRGGLKFAPEGEALPDNWKCDIEGAAAEYVVHRYTNEAWTGLYLAKGADVGVNIGVRQSAYPYAHLIVHPDDRADFNWVLVTGTCNTPVWTFTIRGWLEGAQCKLPEYIRPNRPAVEYWVPQSALRQFP